MKIILNIMRIFSIVICSIILNNSLHAQNLTIDISNPGQGPSAGMIRVTNVGAIGDKKATGLTYEDVEGTPFWDEHWNSAILYFKSGAMYKLPKAKLNLYTTEVHYENENGGELVAETNLIDKIAETISIPLTVLGGAGSLADVEKVIEKHGVIGVAAGSLFVFKGPYKAVLINYPSQNEKNMIFKIN